MRIAILGWGSLVWCPRQLQIDGGWIKDGPKLPIEFSRISEDKRLTAVIDDEKGEYVSVRFATSKCKTLDEAVNDLALREDPKLLRRRNPSLARFRLVAYVHVKTDGQKSTAFPGAAGIVRQWALDHPYDAAIWTDLPSNFFGKRKEPFSVAGAIKHLDALSEDEAAKAHQYILKAPSEVSTPLRRALNAFPP
ncbi:MAG: hypothetical protein ACHQZS_07040 [Candidatus Binatales bacterium]